MSIDQTPIAPTAISEPLDTFLLEVVRTLQAAVTHGIQAVQDNPPAADKAIEDCEEILEVIMAGDVKEWLS